MIEINAIYKCKTCGNIVEVVHAGAGELMCCGASMEKQIPGTSDGAAEKHVPVIEKIEGGYKIKVGSVAHPMLDAHYIEFIEIMCDKCGVQRKYLKPGDVPEATFKCDGEHITAREYCNLHGLWQAKN